MTRSTTWNIHDHDGRYVGQSSAYSPQIAFCQYMSLLGKPVAECDFEYEPIDDNSGRANYAGEEFSLTSTNAAVY